MDFCGEVQGEFFFLCLVLHDLLQELEERGCRVITYVGYVALMVKGKFLDTFYELTQSYPIVVANWADRSGLAVEVNLFYLQRGIRSQMYSYFVFNLWRG